MLVTISRNKILSMETVFCLELALFQAQLTDGTLHSCTQVLESNLPSRVLCTHVESYLTPLP